MNIAALREARSELVAAFVAGELPEVNAGLAALCGPGRVTIVLDEAATPAAAAPRWDVDEERRSTFGFNPSVHRFWPEMVFKRFLDFLPIALAGAEATKGPGATYLNLGDEGHAPGLVFCDNQPNFTLVPDAYFAEFDGYRSLREHFDREAIPFEQRAPVAFWRGSTTGIRADRADVFTLPRVVLCRRARKLGSQADMALVTLAQMDEAEAERIRRSGLVGDYVPESRFNRYQVHIDIDGNSNSWPGLMSKLHSGSPVLKVASQQGFRQWYYDRLVPWVNYVPVRSDMADLEEKIALMFAHPELARKIGEGGAALAGSMTLTSETAWAAPVIAVRLARGI